MPDTMRVTILADNEAAADGLTGLWGFAALLEAGGLRVLFDTGSNGRVLLRNMAALGIGADALDMIFLSHPHWDHTGGLDSVIETSPGAVVILNEGFSTHLVKDLRGLCRDVVVVGAKPHEIAPGMRSTGIFGGQPAEHALVLDFRDTTAVLTGCAHPGIDAIVRRAASMLGRPAGWVIGGFHLLEGEEGRTAACIRELQAARVTRVVPTHCTGDAARAAFSRAWGDACLAGGAGAKIDLAVPGAV